MSLIPQSNRLSGERSTFVIYEMCPAIVSGIVTEDTPVSYWPIDLFTDMAALLNLFDLTLKCTF